MAPAATISFTLQAALSWRGIILQLLPLCHSLHGWGTLQNKNNIVLLPSARGETEPCSFVRRLLLPSALLSRALPNSPRPGSCLCCAAVQEQQLQLGGKEASVGLVSYCFSHRCSRGISCPMGWLRLIALRGWRVNWALAGHQEGDGRGDVTSIQLPPAEITSNKPPSPGNNQV